MSDEDFNFDGLLEGDTPSNDKTEIKPVNEKKLKELEKKNRELEQKVKKLKEIKPVVVKSEFNSTGEPLLLYVNEVIENPDKPNVRTEIDKEFETWLVDNIKEQFENGGTGVQDPISVFWSDTHSKYIINKGHTRHKCATLAGLEKIPAIIQVNSNDWNQVIENFLRNDLTTKDMVKFIKSKKKEGISNVDIAKKLSTNKAWVSKHVSLSKAPPFINGLWDNKNAVEYSVLYDLMKVHEKNSEFVEQEVNKLLVKKKEITVADVKYIKLLLAKSQNNLSKGSENEDEDEQAIKEPKLEQKLCIEFEGKEYHYLNQNPSNDENIVLDNKKGVVIEAPIDKVKIISIELIEL